MKTCIFTFYNFEIDEQKIQTKLFELQSIAKNIGVSVEFVRYNLPDKFIGQDKIISFGLRHLFNELKYEKVVIVPMKNDVYDQETILTVINNTFDEPVQLNGCMGIRNAKSSSV